MKVLVVGCGWLGRAFAKAVLDDGGEVVGVRRSPDAARELRQVGIEPLILDLSDPASSRALPDDVEGIVVCPSADRRSPEAYRNAYVEVNRNVLARARELPLRGLVYTSSTGVFGQRDGSTVDETTPTAPADESASMLVEAEKLVLEAAETDALPCRVVRLSGLYGPGRLGLVERVRRGQTALGEGDDVWVNWCHRDDGVTAVVAALRRGRQGAVYHATDAHPARRREVVTWIASRLGIPPPRSTESGASTGGRRGSHRRISGERTRAELGFNLAYPSFREGLSPLLPGVSPDGNPR